LNEPKESVVFVPAMKRSWNFVVLFLSAALLILSASPRLRADDAADKAQDIAQMKKVWEALMAFKKAKGALPDKLSELVPEFLPDPKVLVSPKDDGNEQNGPLTTKDQKHPSSYGYEWGSQPFRQLSFKQVKTAQLEEFGPVIPLLRCFLHDKALNISHAGDFYETEINWEISPAVNELIAKRGLGPGCSEGRFAEVVATDKAGKPLRDIRVTVTGRYVQGIWLPDRTVATDGEGKVRVPFGPDPKMVGKLSFEGDGYFALSRMSGEEGFEDKVAVTMTMARRASGVIRNSAGEPVAGAQVAVSKVAEEKEPAAIGGAVPGQARALEIAGLAVAGRRPDLNQIASLETDQDGKWKLNSLPDAGDVKFEVTVSHPDYRVEKRVIGDAPFSVEALFAGKGDITMRPAIPIRGQLRDANGAPIPQATIFFRSPPDPSQKKAMPQMPEVKTDENGGFEFRARVAGDSQIFALAKNRPPLQHKFVLTDDQAPLALTPPAGRKLTGQVVDTSRKPVPGVPILFTGWLALTLSENPVIATTDADGRWTWENAPPDPVRGTAILPSGRLWYWQEQGNKPVEIKIPLIEREE
jgi:5-hydroxyisourate hydrolase-like protein (transthyretin family)